MCCRAHFLVLFALFAVFGTGCGSSQPSIAPSKSEGLSQADLERDIREKMKSKRDVELVSFDLKRHADGSYSGTAAARNSDLYDVSIAPTMAWEVKPRHEYNLRNKKPAVKGQVVRYEQFFEGEGSTLAKASGKAISSDDEHIEKETTETEVTAVSDGKTTEVKVRYIEDVRWEKRKQRGGDTTSKNLDGSFKGETLWGRRGGNNDWTYTLIGSQPNDAQRKRLKSMGKPSPPQYPDYRVKPGDTWKIDPREHPEYALRSGLGSMEGTIEFKFERVVELTDERLGLNKEACAEIKATMKMKGKVFEGGEMDVEVEAYGTILRSLDKLLDVQEVSHRTLKIDGETAYDKVGLMRITTTIKGKETVFRMIK